jgi:hypothetical protein
VGERVTIHVQKAKKLREENAKLLALRAENGETQLIYNEDSNDEFEACYGSNGEEDVITTEEGQPQQDETPTTTEVAVQPATIIETTEILTEAEKQQLRND